MIPLSQDQALARIKAETLIESLSWLREFHDRIVVIKFGGNAMVDGALQEAFAQDMAYLRYVGIKPVVVHGGGPQITARLAELGMESEFRLGLRFTNHATMEVVRDVLRNQISAQLAALITSFGAKTIVLSGEDQDLLKASQIRGLGPDGEVDLGLVGEVKTVNPRAILEAIGQNMIPVVSSVALDSQGQLLNVNADSAAAAIAVALGAEKLMVLTDVPGLYENWPDRDSLLSEISIAELKDLLPKLESGMLPKMQACMDAVIGGVPKAHIIDGRQPHSILLEIFTEAGVGTQVTR
jgi:acetylglutamate kinase